MELIESMAIEFDLKHHTFKQIALTELPSPVQDNHKVYWIHCDLNDHDSYKMLIEKLCLPESVTELCEHPDSLPKMIDADDTLTLQIQSLINMDSVLHKKPKSEFDNIIIHLTKNYCFTATFQSMEVISEFIAISPKSVRYAETPCFILFLILDTVVNDYSKLLFNYEFLVEQMDIQIHKSHKYIYQKVMDIKLEVMKVKRYTISVREILMRISGRKILVISEPCQISLYNLSNHAHMLVHESDSIRDMLNGLLDGIDNALMQKLNETIKILTAFASIFLPLTLITGIYGMNFQHIPELTWKYGYFYAISLLFFVAMLLLYIFKRMKLF